MFGDYPVQDVLFVVACVVIWAMGVTVGLAR